MRTNKRRVSSSSAKDPIIRSFEPLSGQKGRIAILTMNRPSKKNAFTPESYLDMSLMINEANKDSSVKSLVITGLGDYYSSGNDLSNFSQIMHPLTMASKAKELLHLYVDAFISFEKPLIAAVNGPAFGIAVTTLGLCDRVIASESIKLKTPFAELGQAPEGCASFSFPQIMGHDEANRILWDGEVFGADEAVKTGLVHETTEGDVMGRALHHAETLANEYTATVVDSRSAAVFHAQRLGKRLNIPEGQRDVALIERLRQVNTEEGEVLEKAWVSKDCFNALGDFLESRKMVAPAMVLRVCNQLGFLWGQPQNFSVKKPGFRNDQLR